MTKLEVLLGAISHGRVGPEENLAWLLLERYKWIEESMRRTLSDRGQPEVTRAEALLMAYLDPSGTRLSELGRRLGVSRQAIHQLVTQLQRRGLVGKVVDESNASAKLVVLTPLGRSYVRAAIAAVRGIEAALSERLGGDDVRRLSDVLATDWGDPISA